jgi:3-hydroxyisobutyrate dehydrogenase-like beta-hydroxyacid dehydrogenase
MTILAFIGFGEVGRTFARQLLTQKGVQVAAYDLLFDDPQERDARIAEARAMGVRVAADAADASRDARFVISAVTAAAAGGVAKAAAAYLRPGQIFLDVNSASPGTKKQAAEHVQAIGAQYVEGAVMAAVSGPGLKVPILAGGPAARSAAETLNGLGMNLTPVATEFGRASATKLSRSIVMKGIEAILMESGAAARHWGVETDVIASLQATYPGIDWTRLAINCAERVATHGIRRAQEMREAGEMMQDMGGDPALCRAIAGVQDRGAKR